MSKSEFLRVSEKIKSPRRGWALLQAGHIDPNWILVSEEAARHHRSLEPAIPNYPETEIVPVVVTGTRVERA